MKNKIFLSTTILSLSYVAIKILFAIIEPNFLTSLLGKIDIIILILSVVLIIITRINDKKLDPEKIKINLLSRLNIILVFFIFLIISISTIFNLNKKTLDWDAVALYDSRAKILQSGYKFSDMNELSKYDDKNKYYYLLYPPFTSLTHLSWYSLNINIPVGLIYSIDLLIFALIFGSIVFEFVGLTGSMATVLFTISNKDIFTTSLIEYTNLPFTVFLVLGTMIILLGLKTSKNYFYLIGFLLIASSSWIRFLEPIWLCVFISLVLTAILLKRFKKMFYIFVFGLVIILSQYLSWGYFQKTVASSPTIFKLTNDIVFESLVGIFTGSFLNILVYYVKSFGLIFIVYVISLIKINKNEPTEYIFIRLVISTSLLMYFGGIYGISFMFDWWREMSGSLVRSSSYLIPLSIFLIVSNLKYLLENNLRSGETIHLDKIIKIIKDAKK